MENFKDALIKIINESNLSSKHIKEADGGNEGYPPMCEVFVKKLSINLVGSKPTLKSSETTEKVYSPGNKVEREYYFAPGNEKHLIHLFDKRIKNADGKAMKTAFETDKIVFKREKQKTTSCLKVLYPTNGDIEHLNYEFVSIFYPNS